MLDLGLILVLAAHLLAVNLASAGPLVCLWLGRRAVRRDDLLARELCRSLARQSLEALSLGIILGGAVLGLLWLSRATGFFEAAARIPFSRYWFGIAELVFSFVCMAAYLALFGRCGRAMQWMCAALALLAGTNLLYHFPPLFAVIGTLAARPEPGNDPIDFRRMMIDPEALSRTLHHVLASFAVAGTVIMANALRMARAGRPESDWRRAATWGARLALAPTLLQLLSGVYVLVEMPSAARERLLGEDWLTSGLFCAALLVSFWLMHRLAALSLGPPAPMETNANPVAAAGKPQAVESLRSSESNGRRTFEKDVRIAMALMALVVLLMVGARHFAFAGTFEKLPRLGAAP